MKFPAVLWCGYRDASPPSRRRGLKSKQGWILECSDGVASLAEAWIEMLKFARVLCCSYVASLAEAWIEIRHKCRDPQNNNVASLAEAWIEIIRYPLSRIHWNVASLAEAWIEISHIVRHLMCILSPPSRRRGLKL